MQNDKNYIVIKTDNHLSFDEIEVYLEDCSNIGNEVALKKLISSHFNCDESSLTEELITKYINKIIKEEKWIKDYLKSNLNVYDSFNEALITGMNTFNYEKSIEKINKSLVGLSKSILDISKNYYDNLFSNGLAEFAKIITEITKNYYENILENGISKFFETINKSLESLDYKEEVKRLDKNVEKLISYGWPVSFEMEDYVFEELRNKRATNAIILNYYNKTKINHIEKEIIKSINFDKNLVRYFKEARKCYLVKSYYGCASLLFAIIDRIISMNFGRYSGKQGIKKMTENNEIKDFSNIYVNYSTIKILESLFQNANDFKLDKKILNRNMLDHGWNQRKIEGYECLQLLLVLNNLLFILNNETNIMLNTMKEIY